MSTKAKKTKMPPYRDIADMAEDDRIKTIGEAVMDKKQTVAFFTDDEEGKAARYVKKLLERYPGLRVISKGPGFVSGTVVVKVGPPLT